MITNSNRLYFAKVLGCGVQLDIRNFLERLQIQDCLLYVLLGIWINARLIVSQKVL